MAERLLDLLDPEELNRSARNLGWIAGEAAGAIVAAAALVLLAVVAHIG
jgi:hypothetical protein